MTELSQFSQFSRYTPLHDGWTLTPLT